MTIRRAQPGDAAALVAILQGIATERVYTAIGEPWSAEAQRGYLESLSPREAIFVAETDHGIAGYQTLELWARSIGSMAHVGQLGTFVMRAARGQGAGKALFARTLEFARAHGYGKFVIQVRASNAAALRFYTALGFHECGRFARHVRIDGAEDDEILLEFFL